VKSGSIETREYTYEPPRAFPVEHTQIISMARAKGKTLGRPRKPVDAGRISALRAQGVSWRAIASELGVGVATLHRASVPRSKTQGIDLGSR